jgi:hypothetical protein
MDRRAAATRVGEAGAGGLGSKPLSLPKLPGTAWKRTRFRYAAGRGVWPRIPVNHAA